MSRVLIASITTLCADDHEGDPERIAAWTANKSSDGVALMLANPDLHLFVAERDGVVLGVGAVNASGVIGLNYVAPEARFSGVSTALLQRLEDALAEQGHREGRLESTRTAQRFYERRGWQQQGPRHSGRMVNGYPMHKALPARPS